jgi:hypothetical protein
MGQKRSDLDTIPMCKTHHDYQHQIGWPAFIRKYQLDIPELLKALTEKPRIEIRGVWSVAIYRGEELLLCRLPYTLAEAIEMAKSRCREHLIDTLFRPLVEKQRATG